jgi:serine/threonine protein kinase
MTITHIPTLPIQGLTPNKIFSFDSTCPISGGNKNVYLGYLHLPGKEVLPIALAKFKPQVQKEVIEDELSQIEKINTLFPNSDYFIQCFYIQRRHNIITGFIFEKGICDLGHIKEEYGLCNPLTQNAFTEKQLYNVCRSMATSLALLHENGLVHKDIKLENYIVTADGKVKLTDFGFVTEANNPNKSFRSTLVYSSPEELLRLSGGQIVMDASYKMEHKDLWTLGMTYLDLFTELEKYPSWLTALDSENWESISVMALSIHALMKEFLQSNPDKNYWGLLKLAPEERSTARDVANGFESKPPTSAG